MTDPILETERLSMRPFEDSDLEWLIGHRSSEEVVEFLGGLELMTSEFVERRMRFYMECFEEFGFSMCVTSLRDSGRRIGVTGLQPFERSGEIEVGYAFDRDQWGRGLATESAAGWLRFGFGTAGLKRVIAVANPDNAASIHVMKKLGMRYQDTALSFGIPVVRYAVSKEEFENLSGPA